MSKGKRNSAPEDYVMANPLGTTSTFSEKVPVDVVSKGGKVPDQIRESHNRRDKYLASLL